MPSRNYARTVSAEYEDYVPEPARTEYRYDDERYQATPVLADTRPDWSTPSRLRDVPQPSSPPEREVERRSEPTWRRSTVEEGTPIAVEILDPVSTKYSRPGDSFNARLASDLLADDGRVAIRKGAEITGHVAEVKKNQRIGGRAKLLVTMDQIELPDGSTAPIEAAWSTQGKSQTPKDAATIGGATVGGAILGRILDHGDGDVIGGLLGAAAGTAVARQTIGQADHARLRRGDQHAPARADRGAGPRLRDSKAYSSLRRLVRPPPVTATPAGVFVCSDFQSPGRAGQAEGLRASRADWRCRPRSRRRCRAARPRRPRPRSAPRL